MTLLRRLFQRNASGVAGLLIVWLLGGLCLLAEKLGMLPDLNSQLVLRFTLIAGPLMLFLMPISQWACQSLARVCAVAALVLVLIAFARAI
jgi:hypothetical protein